MLAADESVGPLVFGREPPPQHILLVDMNAFFAAIEQRCNPALHGRPVLVCGNSTNRTVVTAASYEARPYGIESGMPLFQAQQRCPHAVIIEADPLKYIDIARGIQAILLRFSPTVEIFSVDEAFLALPVRDDPITVARAIKAAIRAEFHLTCSIGIGPNRLLAKMAAGMQKPDGLVWLRAEEVPARFARLPVRELPGVGARLERALQGMGIATAGQLGQAPVDLLVYRFGFVLGHYLHQLGNGLDPTPVHSCFTPPPIRSMGHSYTLAHDTHDVEELRAHLLRLAWAVGRRLRTESYAGRVIRIMARYSDFTSLVREHRFRDDFDQPLAIHRAALWLIEKWDAWARPVRALGVAVADLRQGYRQAYLPILGNGSSPSPAASPYPLPHRERARDAPRDDCRPLSPLGRGTREPGVRGAHQGAGLQPRRNTAAVVVHVQPGDSSPGNRLALRSLRAPRGGEAGDFARERALLRVLDAVCDKYGEKALYPATLIALKHRREGRWSSELGPASNNHKPLGSRRFLLT